MKYQYHFKVADISFCWITGFPLEPDERYKVFFTGETEKPDVIYEVLSGSPSRNKDAERQLYEGEFCRITEDDRYRYRIFPYSNVHIGREITLVRHLDCDDRYRIYLPEEVQKDFVRAKNWSFYMAFDEMFYYRRRVMLHAAYVETKQGAVLFSGPSGIGKSTQARLWEEHADGITMNGDRAILYERDDRIFAAGSPYAGSSSIYRNYQSPVRAIVILAQGERNRIQRLTQRECIFPLMKESTFAFMDEKMKIEQAELLFSVAEKIPVYSYQCRKDESAVEDLLIRFLDDHI